MNMHTQDLTARLTRYLDRKSMPRRLEGKPTAVEDELRALVGAIDRSAPRGADALADWWPKFEARLDELSSAMWPVVKEVSDAAKAVRGSPSAVDLTGRQSLDPAEMAARRMAAGEPVGEGWLWGIGACELGARRLVGPETMTRYRSAAFLARKRIYGDDAALKWEHDRKTHHEDAKAVWRDKSERSERQISIPEKTSKPRDAA